MGFIRRRRYGVYSKAWRYIYKRAEIFQIGWFNDRVPNVLITILKYDGGTSAVIIHSKHVVSVFKDVKILDRDFLVSLRLYLWSSDCRLRDEVLVLFWVNLPKVGNFIGVKFLDLDGAQNWNVWRRSLSENLRFWPFVVFVRIWDCWWSKKVRRIRIQNLGQILLS